MKQGTYIVCNKVKASDTDGYLFLLGKGNAKNRVKKALGIKVNYKNFNYVTDFLFRSAKVIILSKKNIL